MQLIDLPTRFEILSRFNRAIKNDGAAFRQIDRLKNGETRCVITGQQVGLFGGPAYTVLKGISTLIAAKKKRAVPLFWLATEDHDIEEVNHTYCFDAFDQLKKFKLHFAHQGKSVGHLMLTDAHRSVWEDFFSQFTQETPKFCAENYVTAMGKLMSGLFAGTGMVFINPMDFHPYLSPWIEWELVNQQEIFTILNQASLESAPIRVQDRPQLFVYDTSGQRRRPEKGETLLKDPSFFSTTVVSRPLVQQLLFPGADVVVGPTERKYLEQINDYLNFAQADMGEVLDRMSVTFIPPHIGEWIKQIPSFDPGEGKKVRRSLVKSAGFSSEIQGKINRWLFPNEKKQERVLNWWQFEAYSASSLVHKLVEEYNGESLVYL